MGPKLFWALLLTSFPEGPNVFKVLRVFNVLKFFSLKLYIRLRGYQASMARAVRDFPDERGHVVGACGIGKSYVIFGALDAARPSTALVVAPLLQLIREFLRSWRKLRRESWPYELLVLCSERDVTEDGGALGHIPSVTLFVEEALARVRVVRQAGKPLLLFSTSGMQGMPSCGASRAASRDTSRTSAPCARRWRRSRTRSGTCASSPARRRSAAAGRRAGVAVRRAASGRAAE